MRIIVGDVVIARGFVNGGVLLCPKTSLAPLGIYFQFWLILISVMPVESVVRCVLILLLRFIDLLRTKRLERIYVPSEFPGGGLYGREDVCPGE